GDQPGREVTPVDLGGLEIGDIAQQGAEEEGDCPGKQDRMQQAWRVPVGGIERGVSRHGRGPSWMGMARSYR
ncbi:hypothetical protein, partial [Salmonella sp. s54925]|uniref:hypothetical protein n=1 Tax=Salmonella sp. s54925 TaxID=3159674 RepID=UPI00397EA214